MICSSGSSDDFPIDATRKRAHLDRIASLLTSGAVKLPQITTHALADAQSARRVSEGRHLRAKLVFEIHE